MNATIADAILAAVSRVDFGAAHAARRGRDARWPYVPVVLHHDGPVPRQEQITPYAYATREEAIERAVETIVARRAALVERLALPSHRALREQHGLPRDIA